MARARLRPGRHQEAEPGFADGGEAGAARQRRLTGTWRSRATVAAWMSSSAPGPTRGAAQQAAVVLVDDHAAARRRGPVASPGGAGEGDLRQVPGPA